MRLNLHLATGCLIVASVAAIAPVTAEAQRSRPAPPGRAVSTAVPRGQHARPYPGPRSYYPGYGRYYYPRYYPGYYYPGYYYPRYYYPYPYYAGYYPGFYPGFSFSVGFGVGYGYGYGYGYPGWGFYGAYPYGPYYYDHSSGLRIQVTPRDAEVYVDGHFAGHVDSYDGTFQRLYLEPGAHDITIYHERFRPITQKLYLSPREGYRIQSALEPLGPGDAPPSRPVAPAPQSPPAGRRTPPGPGAYEPRESPSADRFGSLSIRVQPADAEILVDGERWQFPESADRLVLELSEGLHRLEIRKDGYEPYSTTIRVRAGETATINVSLPPRQGAPVQRVSVKPPRD